MYDQPLYKVYGPKALPEMTSEELAEALGETDIVVVPVGSTEQHGPHLPLGTDYLQGVEMAKRTVAELAKRGVGAVAGPGIPFGTCYYHQDFPGTIHLQPATLRALMREVCQSLIQHGFTKVALLLAHGGNFPTMQIVAQELTAETGAQVVVLNWLKYVSGQYKEILKSGEPEGHAGEGETARGLASHPEICAMERAQVYKANAKFKKVEGKDHPLMGGGISYPTLSWQAVTPIGSVGNPSLATAETGERVYEVLAGWCADLIQRDLAGGK